MSGREEGEGDRLPPPLLSLPASVGGGGVSVTGTGRTLLRSRVQSNEI